ncbi:transporter, major facilitator family protein [Bifidobacterium dolichotidis]|uniref:Transporter, major facilitator family protein n=1 Tax=Bifidobacterium dolichotidis TaxID=2306976 RepID=A0A430FPL4_9BIFI|nr:MFS transporter [Bifidobacterium dolichotidis]RSX54780.1 transporter, major facilitator family protein [Bifidobacterium dolichotidis]
MSTSSQEPVAAASSAKSKMSLARIAPVMLAFFVMGFVDLVGTATNYVQGEFSLSNGTANLFTTMVFFWFLILSVPTGVLMNKIGRRRTVLISILVTLVAMALPIIGYTLCTGGVRLGFIVASFAFLGIGNTFMQVSLNPLMTVFVTGDRLASTLTTGQFVKAFASLFAPYIAAWGFSHLNGMWWILFVIYLIVGIISYVWLAFDRIEEPAPDNGSTTIGRCFKLLFSDRIVFLCFLGIMAHVGVDVGINAQAPRILMEHTDIALTVATSATMVYFVARMVGCFVGSFALSRISNKLGLRICGVIMVLSALSFAIFAMSPSNPPVWLFWVAVVLVGFGNSNVFSLFLSHALMYRPDRQNEVSGLMLMGLIGGAIFPPIMGAAADAMGQLGAVLVMAVGCLYVLVMGFAYRALEHHKA